MLPNRRSEAESPERDAFMSHNYNGSTYQHYGRRALMIAGSDKQYAGVLSRIRHLNLTHSPAASIDNYDDGRRIAAHGYRPGDDAYGATQPLYGIFAPFSQMTRYRR